jgi:2-hydroxychromene-2-carboxylate isomerase
MSSAPPVIEFWFDFGSNYSYLSMMRIEAAAARAGVAVAWRPFLLGAIFRDFGWSTSPFVLQKEKGDYMWKDMQRQCRKYGLAWTRPTAFPRAVILPSRVALLGAEQPWAGDFNRAMIAMNFVADRDIDSAEAVGEALSALGLPAQAIIDEAQSDANKLRLRQQTETARARGVFGAPTFFVGEDMYWGNDRLDDALADCAALRR